jgi:hypothetical protein
MHYISTSVRTVFSVTSRILPPQQGHRTGQGWVAKLFRSRNGRTVIGRDPADGPRVAVANSVLAKLMREKSGLAAASWCPDCRRFQSKKTQRRGKIRVG